MEQENLKESPSQKRKKVEEKKQEKEEGKQDVVLIIRFNNIERKNSESCSY